MKSETALHDIFDMEVTDEGYSVVLRIVTT